MASFLSRIGGLFGGSDKPPYDLAEIYTSMRGKVFDEAAWQDHLLSGFGGRRLVIWVFGYVRWIPLQKYRMS